MSRMPPDDVSTVHLGQYTRETANAIAGELEAAGIAWWYKEPGWLSSVWEFGVRLFVDRDRLEEAREIAGRLSSDGPSAPQDPAGDR
jgi:hypothetical protein